MKTAHLILNGRATGVGFRYYALMNAEKYRIKGHANNVYPQNVFEIYAQGEDDDLERFIETIRKGTDRARIDSLNIEIVDIDRFERFDIE